MVGGFDATDSVVFPRVAAIGGKAPVRFVWTPIRPRLVARLEETNAATLDFKSVENNCRNKPQNRMIF